MRFQGGDDYGFDIDAEEDEESSLSDLQD